MYTDFLDSTISMQANMEASFNEQMAKNDYVLMIYIDTTDCTSCAIQNVNMLKTYLSDFEKYNTGIVLITQDNEAGKVQEFLDTTRITFPLLYDIDGVFKKSNRIDMNQAFRTFIVNKHKKVIWIGNPILSKKSWDLYNRMMTKL